MRIHEPSGSPTPQRSIELLYVVYYGEILLNAVLLEIGVFTSQLAASFRRMADLLKNTRPNARSGIHLTLRIVYKRKV